MTFKDGNCYLIRFYDHFLHGAEPIICEAFGWVTHQDKNFVYLTWWRVDHKDPKVVKDNTEPFGLVKSAVISRSLMDVGKIKLS